MINIYKHSGMFFLYLTIFLNCHCGDGGEMGFDFGGRVDVEYYSSIYIMNVNGSNKINLTNSDVATEYISPIFSPDGSQILFGSEVNMFIMNIDGSNKIQLTESDDQYAGSHQFSSDGSKIIYNSGCENIYIMNSDGTNKINLTENISLSGCHIYTEWIPRFSPDGSKIVFSVGLDQITDTSFTRYTDIFLMDADGSNYKNLTNSVNEQECSSARFSPDGDRIVFTHCHDDYIDINTIGIDGNNRINLTAASGQYEEPQFSPDGSKILHKSWRDGDSEICVLNADGSDQINLSNHPDWDINPQFSPDGSKILFERRVDGYNCEIYIMNADGSDQQNLSKSNLNDGQSHISPDGSKIIFVRSRMVVN